MHQRRWHRFPRWSGSASAMASAWLGRPSPSVRTVIATSAPPGRPRLLRPRRLRLAARRGLGDRVRLFLPGVPSRRGAAANSVANIACTASTTPTCAKNRRDPLRFPSSTPQNTFNRALIRSTAVRPLYIRSNFFVARGNDGNHLGSTSRHPHRLAVRLARVTDPRHRAPPVPCASPGSGTSGSRTPAHARFNIGTTRYRRVSQTWGCYPKFVNERLDPVSSPRASRASIAAGTAADGTGVRANGRPPSVTPLLLRVAM